MIDSRDINQLHPALQRAASELIRRMKAIGYNVLITSTYRDYEMQNALYAKGRTAPGKIVTNAKAGQSIHNYRLAFDICKNIKGQEYSDSNFFAQAGKIGMEMGLVWGGSWKSFVDKPHFEFTNGLSLAQLQNGAKVDESVRLKWETAIDKGEAAPVKMGNDYVADKAVILLNGVETEIERIFKDGTNYIKLRELEKFGMTIGYDADRKMPVVSFDK